MARRNFHHGLPFDGARGETIQRDLIKCNLIRRLVVVVDNRELPVQIPRRMNQPPPLNFSGSKGHRRIDLAIDRGRLKGSCLGNVGVVGLQLDAVRASGVPLNVVDRIRIDPRHLAGLWNLVRVGLNAQVIKLEDKYLLLRGGDLGNILEVGNVIVLRALDDQRAATPLES